MKNPPEPLPPDRNPRVVLRLYIAGPTERSSRAVVNIRKICEEHLKGHYELDILDLVQNPSLAREDQIVAAPTLARIFPLPVRRFIGDFSRPAGLLAGLGISLSGERAL